MLLWIEGFEGYGQSAGSAPVGMDRRYPVNSNLNLLDVEVGRTGGFAIEFGGLSGYFQTPSLGNISTFYCGFAVNFGAYAAGVQFWGAFEGGNMSLNLRTTAGGEYELFLNNSSLGTTSGATIGTGAWGYFEIKGVIHNSAGEYEVRINGSTVLSATSVDTQVGSNAYINSIRWGRPSGSNIDGLMDDMYIADSTGSYNNTFLGTRKVVGLFPSGAGNSTAFTPNSGSNYQAVDETTIDDDTSYVQSGTSAHKDTYTFGDLPADLGSIAGIQINTDCRETDANPFSLKTVVRSDGVDYADAGQAIGSTSYVSRRRILEVDPDTSLPWQKSAVDSAEFGIEVA
jgi:hypothetical protein